MYKYNRVKQLLHVKYPKTSVNMYLTGIVIKDIYGLRFRFQPEAIHFENSRTVVRSPLVIIRTIVFVHRSVRGVSRKYEVFVQVLNLFIFQRVKYILILAA